MIIYLHGFASNGTSSKVDILREKFSDEIVSPDLPFDPTKVCEIVDDLVEDFYFKSQFNPYEKLIFVGTSLGAFYANYFGHLYDAPAVLVNPSIVPSNTLRSKLGKNINYSTQEEFFVKLAHLNELENMTNMITETYSGCLVNLFLAKDDDVIPYELAIEAFPFPNSICITEDGGHRYDKNWPLVVNKIQELLDEK